MRLNCGEDNGVRLAGRTSQETARITRTVGVLAISRGFDYGSDHPSVTFDGGEAYPEQVRGLTLFILCPTDSINCCAGLRNWLSYIQNALWFNAARRCRTASKT